MASYLFTPAVALLEILVSQQVPGERGHRLNVASSDLVQILELLQDEATGLHLDASAAAFSHQSGGQGGRRGRPTSLLIHSVCPRLKAFSLPSSLTSTCW